MNGTTLLDKVCNKEIYKKNNILSVNQLNCQIKLKEVWKAMNDSTYPIQWEVKPPPVNDARSRRSSNENNLMLTRHSLSEDATFIKDAARIWNLAPCALKECKSLFTVKKEIKKFVLTLPL